ncbi:MAG: choice-of-anchor J domain-containing protein [Bacteroidia bacterium]|nr:choice-of-anchor J domain-containing protein [Bacteroidia bacterium]
MKRNLTLFASFALLFCSVNANAQVTEGGYHPCGTDQMVAAALAADPVLKAQFEEEQRQAAEADRIAYQQGYSFRKTMLSGSRSAQQSPPQYIIPVVFHIVHDYGTENISDAQVLDAVRILNEDYRKLNADTAGIVSTFQGIAADASIEFRLAQLDPNGNCTNGIDRVNSSETYVGDDGSKLNYWNRARYLNIWVVKAISNGAAGYAYLPGSAPTASVDGIIILSTYVGSIGTGNYTTARALTHEVGHFLNLLHVWGTGNSPGVTCGNDNVSDTPTTKGWTSCNLTTNDVCVNNVEENVQNYMDYSYCYRMFTNGQRTRMHNALNSASGQRNSLVTTTTANATGINNPQPCAPIADFTPVNDLYVCEGGSLTFTDVSYNGQPTSYNWSFPGGTPSTSSDSVPTIQYNTAGTYSVSLTVANAQGSDNFSRTNYVHVLPAAAQYTANFYQEGMENTTIFTNDWDIENPQGNGWTNATTAAATGTRSCRLDNTTAMAGQTDAFISPSINFAAMNNPVFTFKVAFAQRAGSENDRLRVYMSTDCGATWLLRYTKAGTNLSTRSATTNAFVPTANEWRTETVTLSSVQLSGTNVRIKFEFESDGGNDIFIDDINIQGATGVVEAEDGISSFNVFPNPANDNSTVEFSLAESQNMIVDVVDLNGKTVQSVHSGNLSAGMHRLPINVAELSAGMYFVRLQNAEGNYLMRKLLVE